MFGLQGRHAFQIFAINQALGKPGEFGPVAERIIAASDDGDLWLPGQICLQREIGQRQQARETLQRLGNLAGLPKDDLHLIALIYLTEACVALRGVRHCARLYEVLLPYRGLNVSLPGPLMLGSVSGYLDLLATATRRFDDAKTHYEEAIAMNAAMKARPALVRTQVDYARLRVTREPSDSCGRARELLAQARPVAEELGLRPVLHAIDDLSRQAELDGLTRRELDILRIAATGSSNSRLAETLHISQSTVTTHLRSVFRKTGATNRTEASDYARRTGRLDPS